MGEQLAPPTYSEGGHFLFVRSQGCKSCDPLDSAEWLTGLGFLTRISQEIGDQRDRSYPPNQCDWVIWAGGNGFPLMVAFYQFIYCTYC